MEFNVSSADLLKGLSDVAKAIPAITTLPILENFLFALDGDKLWITASDQELTLRTAVAVQSAGENGSIAVPSRQMTELLKTLPDQPISIRTTSDGSFECVWSNGNSSLPYFPAEDFPEIKGAGQDAARAVFPAAVLSEGIRYTVFATADEEMRPVMNGIYFDMDSDGTTLVATDAQKLITYHTTECKVAEKASFVLHKKAANVLKIDRLQLFNAVRRVSVCANKASNHVKFELRPGQLEITAQDLGFALAAYEKISCDYCGDGLTIGFKSSHILDMLGNMESSTIVMKFADERRAVLIVPSEEEEESGKICGIMMPIMIS